MYVSGVDDLLDVATTFLIVEIVDVVMSSIVIV